MLFHGFYILSTKPLIVSFLGSYPFFGGWVYQEGKLTNQPLPKWFRPKHVLEHVPCWTAPWYQMARRQIKQILHSIEGRTHHLIVNTSDEEAARKRFLVRGAHFNHNFYINENIYKQLNQQKHYDAIYTARLVAWKRHWLAKQIDSLMVISYGGDLHGFCPELKHAEFNYEFLPKPELAKKYNQAYCGLCLSAVEGPMLASTEYLLCGIPVVSTPSKGGRDVFFNEHNSMVVPPETDAIARAVRRWKESPSNPQEIREQTLHKINNLRLGYCAYVAKLIQQEGGDKYSPEELMEKYFASPDGINCRFVRIKDLPEIKLEDFSLDK